MRRYYPAAVLLLLSASLLLPAQPLPQPQAPALEADPFGPAAPAPAEPLPVNPFDLPPAAPQPKPMAAVAESGTNSEASTQSLVIFADASLGREVVQKMTPAERLAYHLDRPARILIVPEVTTLQDIVPELSEMLGVNVELDLKALEEAAFDRATPIAWQMTHPAQLGASLRRLLHSLGLDYMRLNDTLLITTRSAFESKLFLKTYNLDREMFRPRTAGKFESPGNANQENVPEEFGLRFCGFDSSIVAPHRKGDDDFLVDVIHLIKPETWKANGGQGELHLDLAKSLLIVNCTQDVHDEIELLLTDLRKAARSHQQAIQANAQLLRRIVFRLKLPEKQAGPAQQFGDGLAGNFIPLEPAYTMKEVADLIKQQIEPHTWKDDKHSISILGECLIINQSEAVQTKIYHFLRDLGITREQFDENNRPFYGFS